MKCAMTIAILFALMATCTYAQEPDQRESRLTVEAIAKRHLMENASRQAEREEHERRVIERVREILAQRGQRPSGNLAQLDTPVNETLATHFATSNSVMPDELNISAVATDNTSKTQTARPNLPSMNNVDAEPESGLATISLEKRLELLAARVGELEKQVAEVFRLLGLATDVDRN